MHEGTPPDIGAKVQALRQQHGLTLRALAKISEVSPNTINLIERGMTSPTVSTLHRLAEALRVPIAVFFEERTEQVDVIIARAAERPRTGSADAILESLGNALQNQTIEPFVVTLEPAANEHMQPVVHRGHELIYCIQGEIEYEVDNQVYHLAADDALLFEARLPHRWRNPASEPARFLLVLQAGRYETLADEHLRT